MTRKLTCSTSRKAFGGLFEGTVFVVEGSGGFHCVGTAFRYGAEYPGQDEVVYFYDPAARRFRYIKPLAVPVEGDATITWDTVAGHWRARALTNDDQSWVLLPGQSLPDFESFRAWCEEEANAKELARRLP